MKEKYWACCEFRLLELLVKLHTSEVVVVYFAYFQDCNVHQIVWHAIDQLTEEEISEARRECCCCVNSIIDAYKEKLHKERVLEKTIKLWKERCQVLKRHVTKLTEQLASKVCDDCRKKRIAEQMGSMSMQENKSESGVIMKCSENCIDHKVKSNKNLLLCNDSFYCSIFLTVFTKRK